MAEQGDRALLRQLAEQYQQDAIGSQYQTWRDLDLSDSYRALQQIFLYGACFDFAAALHELTGWPVHEIQWGTPAPDDPSELDCTDYNIHRVVGHPSGRYLDASGWTDRQQVLVNAGRADAGFQWMGEADPDTGPFDVDFELVKKAVVAFLPAEVCRSLHH